MDVRFYDYEHELKAIAAHKVSVNWVMDYAGVGTFEMHLSPKDAIVKILMGEDYLIAVEGDRAAVIVSKTIDKSECVIYGRTLNYLLEKRVVLPFEDSTGSVKEYISEKMMPEYMSYSFNDFTDFAEAFELTAPQTFGGFLADICDEHDLGYEVKFHAADSAGNFFTLHIYEGEEKGVVISEAMRTGSGASYSDDALDYASAGYYNLTDDDGNSAWKYLTKDEESGIYLSEAILDSTSESEATAEIERLKWKKAASAQVRKLSFGEDYNLGDIVTVQIIAGDFKKSTKYRVVEVHLWEEGTESGEEPTFEEISS